MRKAAEAYAASLGAGRGARAVFTIDGKNTQLMDQAFSVQERGPGVFRLGIHVADIGSFLLSGNPLLAEAKERARNLYVRGYMRQMLPPQLTRELSLQKDQDRLAFSIYVDFNASGALNTRSFRLRRERVRSSAKLSYE